MHVCPWAWLHQLAGRVRSGCSEITIIIALNSALTMGRTANQVIERTFVCPLLYQGGAIADVLTLGSCSTIISRQMYRDPALKVNRCLNGVKALSSACFSGVRGPGGDTSLYTQSCRGRLGVR
jgi:hypothetical protein